jgi:hypothetical protein
MLKINRQSSRYPQKYVAAGQPFRRYLLFSAFHCHSPDAFEIYRSPYVRKLLISFVFRFHLFDVNLGTVTFWPHFDQPIFRSHFLESTFIHQSLRQLERDRWSPHFESSLIVFDKIRPCPNINFFTVSRSDRRSGTSPKSCFERKIREMRGGESSSAPTKARSANLGQLFDRKRSNHLNKEIWRDRQSPARTFRAMNIWKRLTLAQREKWTSQIRRMDGTKGWMSIIWFWLGNTADNERTVAVIAAACHGIKGWERENLHSDVSERWYRYDGDFAGIISIMPV